MFHAGAPSMSMRPAAYAIGARCNRARDVTACRVEWPELAWRRLFYIAARDYSKRCEPGAFVGRCEARSALEAHQARGNFVREADFMNLLGLSYMAVYD
jgi:hypothetical protein